MKKENTLQWKRIITFVILVYGVLKFTGHFYSIFISYYHPKNPLIPDFIDDFIAFPHYFLIPIWGVALWLGWRFYRNDQLMTQRFWLIFAGLVGMMFLEGVLYYFLMRVNPFA